MDRLLSYLSRLISFDTTSSRPNRDCVDFICQLLRENGIEAEAIQGPDGKANLWATVGPQAGGGVVLAGHLDVVPVDGQKWQSDPFTLREGDGKIFGRGSCDMKGFIACALDLAIELSKTPRSAPLHLAFTYDEETTMAGAQAILPWLKARGIKPAWVWLGEPTELKVVTSHKGVRSISTRIKGVAAHSSAPAQGVNAALLAARIANWIDREGRLRLASPIADSVFDPACTTFNVGRIEGGAATNIIAEHCEIEWEYRLHPNDDEAAIWRSFDELVECEIRPELQRFPAQTSIKSETHCQIPPFLAAPNNIGEHQLCHLTGSNCGCAVSFGTEAGFFQQLGADVVICGPGSIRQAHQPDEFVTRDQLAACAQLMRRWSSQIAAAA